MNAPDITAVIVSWNSGQSLASSLGALRHSAETAGADVDIIVVDNASADSSRRIAVEAGADRVVANPVNAGYVVAASQGMALARGAWIMLANPDLTVSEHFVGRMLDTARSVPADVACLVPDIRYAADPSVVNSRGIEVDALGIPAESDAGLEAVDLAGPVDVFGPSTSGCLIRRAALVEVGGLEPLYFAYLEDVDVAWRLRKKGYRALVVPGAVALHEGSASTGEGSWLKAFLVARNRRSLFRLHGPPGLGARAQRMVTEIGHATVQALSGSSTASVRGRAAALRTRRYTRFLRASNRITGIPDDVRIELAPRQTLGEALQRKRAAASLMRRVDGRFGTRRPTRVETQGPVRVLVDATNLKPGQGGIRTYTIGLLDTLAAQPGLSLVVVTSVPEVTQLGPMELVEVSPRTRGVAARAVWRERNLAALARSRDVDVVLTPVPELPLRPLPVPSAIVVHDVGPLVAPAFYSLAQKLRYQAVLPRACRLASAVVCVSHATMMGLHTATGLDPRRCEVIGEGPQLLDQAASGPGTDEPYLLYVGSLDARKNVETLITAVVGAAPPLPARLLVVGPVDGDDVEAFNRRLARRGAGERVRHLGFVTPEQLTTLYRDALAVVLPSLYEGFGLPVLEAMRCGTPVVASDIPSLREVADDAALYVDRPLDAVALRDALVRISEDSALRAELVANGERAAARFSWQEVGERFASLLTRLARGGGTSIAEATASIARTAPPRPSAALSSDAEAE